MQRKDFLRKGLFAALGAGTITPLISACNKEDISANSSTTPNNSNTATGTPTSSDSCTISPMETAGPFPTKTPSSLVTNDIRSDRPGVPLTIRITINNSKNSCAALAGAIVDIWHCDKDGYYS
ncbi:hypothetical protein SAMN05444008_111134 [Cnuella takakiae]|uniref:Intradiol ring-cleavage dioxygenases domain-containing protein n=1 Tax=Cnuella takakiae TaxID=1302690 RepID=A0A1M5DYN6_9BACT|nr:hypothetical protein [Cnuella takakiae]SHF72079.1 hypothetical protein SAMN05444008_111134 [Cnuella takakiae]